MTTRQASKEYLAWRAEDSAAGQARDGGADAAAALAGGFGLGRVTDYPRHETLSTLFSARVAASPDAPAVIERGRAVSYRDLDALVNAVACRLMARGVGVGDIVGVSLERSALMVAAMLAPMRLGAAYAPLDPSNPPARLHYIAENSRARAVLTTQALAGRLGYAAALTLDDLTEAEIAAAAPVPPAEIDPLSTAYVAYTSGSTGQPKGVMGTHRATVNRFYWMWREYPFEADEVGCQKTAISFVDSIWEIFGALLAGVPQVVIDNATVRDPAALVRMLGEHKVTRIMVVPSLLKAIVEDGIDVPSAAPSLRWMLTGGERLPKSLARRFMAAAPDVALMNIYGSSEVAADVTSEVVRELDTEEVPIGRPIHNVRLYVLDEARRPVPPGEIGELYAGGEGLAAGYLHRPDLTAERFLPDPFSDVPGAVMFATGDRVNWLPDGRLLYRGRADHQVKIRGARVELGEIEAALAAEPGVAEAVAVARPDIDGDMQIVAFVSGRGGAKPDPAALRAALVRLLPDYAVPARIEALEAMPLNPNGKVDRIALAQLVTGAGEERGSSAPETEIETEIHRIWTRLLDRPGIGTEDDFFELGGHSLMAVRLFARIKARFGVDLPIATLLTHPTIRSLSKRVGEAVRAAPPAPAAAHSGAPEDSPWDTTAVIHPGPGTGARALFIVGGVGGNVNNLFELGKAVGRHRPLIGLQTRGILGHRAHETIEATAADHIANIRRHQPEGPYLLAGYSGGAFPAFEMARQLEAAGEEVDFLGILDMHAPGFSADVSVSVSERLRLEAKELASRGIGAFLSRLRIRMRALATSGWLLHLHDLVRPERARLTRLEKAWEILAERYRPGPYGGTATLFVAEDAEGITARIMLEADPEFGWTRFVKGGLEVVSLKGNHFDFLIGEGATDLAACIETALAALGPDV